MYKDEEENVKQYSALCPHMKGVVCWNSTEKSFDCPVHGSRFSREGICVMGPAKGNLPPVDDAGKTDQEKVAVQRGQYESIIPPLDRKTTQLT